MIYNEKYITTVCTVEDLVAELNKLPRLATVELAGGEPTAACEVWYDLETNTVVLK